MFDSITVWIPTLKRGAPSNTAGILPTVYATREQALAHEHWANQAPWADARSVEIVDAPWADDWDYESDSDRICAEILDTASTLPDGRAERAAKLIKQGKRVEALRFYVTD